MVAKPHAEAEAAVTEVDTHSDAVVAEPHAEAAVTDNDTHSEVDFVGEADEKKTEQTKTQNTKKKQKNKYYTKQIKTTKPQNIKNINIILSR